MLSLFSRPTLLAGALLSVFSPLALLAQNAPPPAPVPPVVAGYARFFGDAKSDAAAGGRMLLTELSCTACHKADFRGDVGLTPKAGPILDGVTKRVKADWLVSYIANPHVLKPGTTMPHLFAGASEAEAKKNAEAIVHYLASLGGADGPTQASPKPGSAARGQVLFNSVGCAVCHGPRGEGVPVIPNSIPLPDVNLKYTLPSMTEFLLNPLHNRPAGRMPSLNLSSREAEDVSAFRLSKLEPVAAIHYAYYEGNFTKVPDFATLKAKDEGAADSIDVKYAKNKDNFALKFEGAIRFDADGEYTFSTRSDDGSILWVDGKKVVENDGIHAAQEHAVKVKLTAGVHTIVVGFFEASGGEEIVATIEGPGLKRQPVADMMGSSKPPAKFESLAIQVDPAKAAEGKKLFASTGCASCHQLTDKSEKIASTRSAPTLTALKTDGGCIAASVPPALPNYRLSDRQRATLAAAIKQPAAPDVAKAENKIHRTMLQFNCYACHNRGDVGGVEEARNALFQTDQKEMGDEARIPPHLTGVGAKLKAAWLKHMFTESSKDRPYMFTRMPKFGAANIEQLAELFTSVDKPEPYDRPKFTDDIKTVKKVGRELVGTKALSCIKCHTFGSYKAQGVQALSLTTMNVRLREDWFYNYMLEPTKFRPGTRMPAPWPNGNTFFPKLLKGDVPQQVVAVWDYLSDGPKSPLPDGLYSESMLLTPNDKAIIYRNFIQDAGPRAIGVGYPESVNIAWDANGLRLALAWQGAFIDASKHWTGRGAGFQGPAGENILKLPPGAPFAVLAADDTAWPMTPPKEQGYQFRGYKLDQEERPAFHYSYGNLAIEEYTTPTGTPSKPGLARKFTLTGAPDGKLYYRAAYGPTIAESDGGWYSLGNYKTKIEGAKPIIRKVGGNQELLVPIDLSQKRATFTQLMDW